MPKSAIPIFMRGISSTTRWYNAKQMQDNLRLLSLLISEFIKKRQSYTISPSTCCMYPNPNLLIIPLVIPPYSHITNTGAMKLIENQSLGFG